MGSVRQRTDDGVGLKRPVRVRTPAPRLPDDRLQPPLHGSRERAPLAQHPAASSHRVDQPSEATGREGHQRRSHGHRQRPAQPCRPEIVAHDRAPASAPIAGMRMVVGDDIAGVRRVQPAVTRSIVNSASSPPMPNRPRTLRPPAAPHAGRRRHRPGTPRRPGPARRTAAGHAPSARRWGPAAPRGRPGSARPAVRAADARRSAGPPAPRRLGARDRGQPVGHRRDRPRRRAPPRAEPGPERHGRLHARVARAERRHRLLRKQVRCRGVHPRADGRGRRPRRCDAAANAVWGGAPGGAAHPRGISGSVLGTAPSSSTS
jgi:hypothetical protein